MTHKLAVQKSKIAPPWRLAGVQVSGLIKGFRQDSFFDNEEEEKRERLYKALDILREKYGRPAVQ